MRWIALAILAGCGGAADYHCEDQCAGAQSVAVETNYYLDCGTQTACPKTTLICTCANGGAPLRFIEPESVVACTTLRESWKAYCP